MMALLVGGVARVRALPGGGDDGETSTVGAGSETAAWREGVGSAPGDARPAPPDWALCHASQSHSLEWRSVATNETARRSSSSEPGNGTVSTNSETLIG
jgi:hypothetical protein